MLDGQQVATDPIGEPTNAQVMARLRAMDVKLDAIAALLGRAEPLLKLAEGWAKLRAKPPGWLNRG